MPEQRLNIIFTGDVSQLSKAMQSAEADLANFEQKLKDSLGVEAFAQVNKAVDSLRQKLISLSSIDIKANPAQAVTAIKEVQTGISSLKSSDILLKIDDGKVVQQLQNVDKLLDSLTATITIDSSGLKSQIDKIRAEFAGLKLPELNGLKLVTGFDAAIQDVKTKLASLSDEKLNILANGEQAEAVINEILSDIKTLKDAKVLINADGTQAEGVIDRIQTELNSLKGNLSIDTTEFQRKLAQITSGVSEINLKADTSQIDSSIKSIREKLAAIDITANPDSAFAALREISSELNKIKSSQVFINLDDDKAIQQVNDLDKLLDSLTATIRIDADVKSQIDKIKTQLAGFTIDINADASNTENVLKSIQSKLSLLQDEKFIISADGRQAEAIIDEIFSDLKNLKDTKVLINADGTPALSALENIQNKLEETLQGGKLTIDTTELQRKLDSVKSLSGELVIESDVSQVESSIKSIREKLAFFKTIDINADPQQALSVINEILTEISKIKSNDILLRSDNTDVLDDINQIQTRLRDIKTNINITANLDTKNLEALLKPLATSVSVSVNTKQAEAELKALLTQVRGLKGQDILINLDGTQVVKTIDAIERELVQLQAKLKTATNPADIAKLTQQLQLFKNSLSATSVNQFSSSMNRAQQATFAFSQVLREAPAFAFSLQTGLLGISNNLPILADRFKEARASGLSTTSIFKEMAKGLVSLPGLMTIASTAAIFIAGAFNKSGKESEEAARKIKDFGQIVTDSTDSLQGDVAKIQALVKAATDTASSFTVQKNAIEELRKENKNYFGELEAGKSSFQDITKAANAYTEALVQQAIVKGLQEEISELAKQIRVATKDYFKAADEVTRKNKQITESLKSKPIGPGANPVGAATVGLAGLEKNLTKSAKKVSDLKNNFNELILEIQKAVGIQLNLKPLSGGVEDGFKSQTDDIISRARAFVKQFGETFVVPDLDESFTNTKDKILNSATQLLKDVEAKNLKIKIPFETEIIKVKKTEEILDEITGQFKTISKTIEIKIPVITDLDFLPIPEEKIKSFTDEIKDRIKEGLEKGVIEAKLQISIDPPALPEGQTPELISKKQTEEIDKLVAGFLQLGDRGARALQKIDFTDVNKGIAEGKKKLAGLNEEFRITEDVGLAIGESFSSAFSAILDNEDPLKAFFRSIIQELQRVIAKLIATKIAAAFLSAAFPGAGKLGSLVGEFAKGGQANFGFGGTGSIRALDINITGSIIQRGTDNLISLSNSQRSLGRIQ
jgi:chromosome segregation ATPase